ncbi:MAG TPA: single-stranded DNA-binding protein [Candidatus Saccharimonadales bacterium]|jgi:single-strand DNA-binding protein|nr:single-stranded DNA-binding protein [Candidatus Saccharimonadales bacterium]
MSKSINQVILMGNLTRDPELRTTPGGQSVCSFGMAINRSWQGQDGQAQEAVDYFDITAWGKLGELVNQYMAKGRKCLVQGRLSFRSWEKDGQKHSKVEVVATDVTFLDGGGQGGDGGSAPSAPRRAPAKKDDTPNEAIDDKPIDLSEIPF